MTEAKGNSFITDPSDLQYISDLVNQVLEQKHELGSIHDFQSALKEMSLSQGREVQMNLISDKNQWFGFNFSFKNDPNKTTSTIPFKQQLQLNERGGSITPHVPPALTIDVAAKPESNLSTRTPKGELVVAPTLQAEGLHILPEDREELVKSPAPGVKANPSLARIATHLASRNEIDGLWLTGLTLKTGTTLAQHLETEPQPDMQAAGNAVIKRFEQVLPQQFADLKNGNSPQTFNWKDPHSGNQYRFEFEAATFSIEGESLTPAALTGFDASDKSRKPVFSAFLVDSKRDRWLIQECDFNPNQLRSLTACNRSGTLQKSASVDNEL